MSLLNGPDVAGILDALGRHDAAETLRLYLPEHETCEAEMVSLQEEIDSLTYERDELEERVGQLKTEVEAMRPVVEAAEKLATNGSCSALLDLADAAGEYTKEKK